MLDHEDKHDCLGNGVWGLTRQGARRDTVSGMIEP